MTESEWLSCLNIRTMFTHLRSSRIPSVSDRKLRLYVCACCRLSWTEFTNKLSHQSIEVGEHFADGLATDKRRSTAMDAALNVKGRAGSGGTAELATFATTKTVEISEAESVVYHFVSLLNDIVDETSILLAGMLRDVLGTVFRPITVEPLWCNPTVLSLARTAYEERCLPSGNLDPEHLSILADALEDAGCTDAWILKHCRSPGPHVRGCWVVDLLTGKS